MAIGDRLQVTNAGEELVRVCGMGIAPGRTASLSGDDFRVWRREEGSAEIAASLKVELWGGGIVDPTLPPDPLAEPEAAKPEAPAAEVSQAEAARGGKPSPTRHGQVTEAVRGLDPDDRTLYNREGMPKATVVSDRVGFRVSAAEAAAAWEIVKAERQ